MRVALACLLVLIRQTCAKGPVTIDVHVLNTFPALASGTQKMVPPRQVRNMRGAKDEFRLQEELAHLKQVVGAQSARVKEIRKETYAKQHKLRSQLKRVQRQLKKSKEEKSKPEPTNCTGDEEKHSELRRKLKEMKQESAELRGRLKLMKDDTGKHKEVPCTNFSKDTSGQEENDIRKASEAARETLVYTEKKLETCRNKLRVKTSSSESRSATSLKTKVTAIKDTHGDNVVKWPTTLLKGLAARRVGGVQTFVASGSALAPLRPIEVWPGRACMGRGWCYKGDKRVKDRKCDANTQLVECSEQASAALAAFDILYSGAPELPNQMLGGSLSSPVTIKNTPTVFVHDGSIWTGSAVSAGSFREPAWFKNGCDMDSHRCAAIAKDAKNVQQSRIYKLDLISGASEAAYTRTYMTGEYEGYGQRVPRNIVSVQPLVVDSICELYVYSRSFQVQPECQKKFDSSTNIMKNRFFRGADGVKKSAKCLSTEEGEPAVYDGMPMGGSRQCAMVTPQELYSARFERVPFDCCIEVHHHVERLSCNNPTSHLVKIKDKVDDLTDVLKLGNSKEEATTVYKTAAFKGPMPNAYIGKIQEKSRKPFGKDGAQSFLWNAGSEAFKSEFVNARRRVAKRPGWSPPYWDFLSPKMGMAVSKDSIFILGGEPLSLTAYQRLPGNDGHHELVDVFVENLCYPVCGARWGKCPSGVPYKGDKRDSGVGITWDGVRIGPKEKAKEWGSGVEWHPISPTVSLIATKVMSGQPKSSFQAGTPWAVFQSVWAGGALALESDIHGNALRVYGLSHCGTLILVEPAKKRSVVMFHFNLLGTNPGENNDFKRIDSSLAVQRYSTPTGDVSKVYISISTKAADSRWTLDDPQVTWHPSETGTPKYFASSKIYIVSVNALLSCRKLNTGDWGKQCKSANGKLPCIVPLKSSWVQVNGENRYLRGKIPCKHTLEVLSKTTEARSLIYAEGMLWWYGGQGFEIKRLPLDKAIPCKAMQAIMGDTLDAWCTDSDQCANHHKGSIMLNEDHVLQPWTIAAYKKQMQKNGLTKTMLCSHPSLPTTRHSPENCCVWKNVADKKASKGDLILW